MGKRPSLVATCCARRCDVLNHVSRPAVSADTSSRRHCRSRSYWSATAIIMRPWLGAGM